MDDNTLYMTLIGAFFAILIYRANKNTKKYLTRKCSKCGKELTPKNDGAKYYDQLGFRVWKYKCDVCDYEFYKPSKH